MREVLRKNIWLLALLAVVALGLGLRLHDVLTSDFPPIEYDQKNYVAMAIRLVQQGVYAYNDTQPNALVTPGFPLLLALVFKLSGTANVLQMLSIIRLLQVGLSAVYISLMYAVGSRLFGRAAGLLAALFAAVYGPFVMVTGLILTEVFFLSSFLTLIYFQVRIIQENRFSDHIWAGLFLALSVLIRPNCLIVAATPYLFLWVRERRMYARHLFAGVGAFALAMSPWWLRNALTFHEFVFIARGEAANPFLGGTDPYGKVPIDWDIPAAEQFTEGVRRIREGLSTDPFLWLRWFTFGKLSAMFKNSIYWWPYPKQIPGWYTETLRGLHYAVTYIGFSVGILFAYYRWQLAFITANLMLFLSVHLLFIPEPRYTIGMMPLLMLITAYAVITAACRLAPTRKRRQSQPAPPAAGPM